MLFVLAAAAAAGTVSITYRGPNGERQGGAPVGPYLGTVNGSPAKFICDDFLHSIHPGEKWNANVSTFDSLKHVRFKDNDTLQDYEEAGFLVEQMLTAPKSEYGDIQYAIWAIFNPSVVNAKGFTTTGTTSSSHWLNLTDHQTFRPGEFSNLIIYTPTSNGSRAPQEFFSFVPTPEPGTLLLLGTGLVWLSRRKKKQ